MAEAIVRDYRMGSESENEPLGIYSQVVKLLPPPRNPSPAMAKKYLDELEALRQKLKREVRSGAHPSTYRSGKDFDQVVGETFRFMRDRKRYLNEEEYRKYLKLVVGLALSLYDVKRPTKFEPVPIPEDLRPVKQNSAA